LAFIGYNYIDTQINTINWKYILGSDNVSYLRKFIFVTKYFPLEGGWFVFLVCASVLVFLFSLFALYPVFKGQTLNESIKWDELNESLNQVPILIEKVILDCNQNGISITSEILEKADQKDQVKISNLKNLKNIYSRGTLGSVIAMIYPYSSGSVSSIDRAPNDTVWLG